PRRCSVTVGCCCSTRHYPEWTRLDGAPCASGCASSRPAALRCCSRRPTLRRWSRWRRACSSCGTAASFGRHPPARCCGSGCSRSCSMRRPPRRRPGFVSPPTVSRPTWARAVRRRRSPCAASTASRCARRACGFARWRTRCSTRRVTARVDAPAGGFYVSAVTLALHNTLTRRLEPFQPPAPPRATQSVPAMVRLVQRLLDAGVAYRGEDGSVYFAIAKFPSYGRLSQLDRREIKIGARVASDEYAKDDPRDFALWKRADPIDERVGAAWDAPFGRGRPGWHLECSAM